MQSDDGFGFVSTGDLPARERVRRLVEEALERFAGVDDGANADSPNRVMRPTRSGAWLATGPIGDTAPPTV